MFWFSLIKECCISSGGIGIFISSSNFFRDIARMYEPATVSKNHLVS
jgi:hypothetical protein